MECPVCKKYFCVLKAFNDYQVEWYREFFGHTPSFEYKIPETITEVVCPNCKSEVKIEKGLL